MVHNTPSLRSMDKRKQNMIKELSPLEDRVHKAVNAPETITDEEREAWLQDPEFMEAFQTMMGAKQAMLDEKEVNIRQAFDSFVAQHQDSTTKPSPHINWWRVTIAAAAAACIAGWWLLPKVMEHEPQADSTNTIYYADVPEAAITITEGDDVVIEKKQTRQTVSKKKNIVVNGDTIIYQPLDPNRYPVVESTIKVSQGNTAMLVLSDGTKVWLNTHSSLIYPNAFAANTPRQVALKGEAYFDVTRDEKRPFIVDCGELQATVLGTTFNVRNYQGSNPCITLEQGSVQVSGASQQVLLSPSQSVTLTNDSRLEVANVDLESVLCWRDGSFFFDGKPLREVLMEMGRWYNVNVIIEDETHLNDRLHFRGERSWELQELVESLNIICDVQLDIEDGALILR